MPNLDIKINATADLGQLKGAGKSLSDLGQHATAITAAFWSAKEAINGNAGALVSFAATAGQAIRSLATLNPWLAAIAVIVGAGSIAWKYFTEETDEAKEATEKIADAYQKAHDKFAKALEKFNEASKKLKDGDARRAIESQRQAVDKLGDAYERAITKANDLAEGKAARSAGDAANDIAGLQGKKSAAMAGASPADAAAIGASYDRQIVARELQGQQEQADARDASFGEAMQLLGSQAEASSKARKDAEGEVVATTVSLANAERNQKQKQASGKYSLANKTADMEEIDALRTRLADETKRAAELRDREQSVGDKLTTTRRAKEANLAGKDVSYTQAEAKLAAIAATQEAAAIAQRKKTPVEGAKYSLAQESKIADQQSKALADGVAAAQDKVAQTTADAAYNTSYASDPAFRKSADAEIRKRDRLTAQAKRQGISLTGGESAAEVQDALRLKQIEQMKARGTSGASLDRDAAAIKSRMAAEQAKTELAAKQRQANQAAIDSEKHLSAMKDKIEALMQTTA